MTIKNKIRLSNILMVLIPISVTALIVFLCMKTSFGSYWHSLETMYQDENGIQSAQSLIYTYQQELWENNWGSRQTADCSAQPIQQTETMYHLEQKLTKMGYHFTVKKNGQALYSNLSDADMEAALKTAGEALHTANSLTASCDNVSVIKNTFHHNAKEFSIIAVNSGQGDQPVESYLRNYIMKYVLLFLLLFILLTVAVNGILSRWVSRSVLIPLGKLRKGTHEIKEGNLDTKLEYEKNDEFGQVCRDFEEMRAYLKESVEQRLENERRRREMINGVSHDLRTPLTSIGGYLDGLIDGIANTPEKQARYFNAIKTRTRDLERLVDSLSEYNRLDSGRMKVHMEPGDLKVFVEQYMEAYAEEAQDNHVAMLLEAESGRYPMEFDGAQMKRVFDNLFTNTIRYRVNPKSQVTVRLNRKDGGTQIRVIFKDDGPGVPEESLERIFETFYRTDEARSHAGRGSGIGLAVVKEIVAGHGGTVHAENDRGLAIIMDFPADTEKGE